MKILRLPVKTTYGKSFIKYSIFLTEYNFFYRQYNKKIENFRRS